ncbi:MAG TPA: hypothetical protein PKC96_01605 [Bacilli bacterium]|nr:hypothetical protein [Bacilli bacterium]
MKTSLLDLTEEELKTFLTYGIPKNFLRSLYVKISKLAEKLKGFRSQKAPHEMLVNTSCHLIKRDKDAILLKELARFYDNYLANMNLKKQSLIEDGYSESMASSIVVNESLNEDFRPLFYRLENIDEKAQKEISENINLLSLIKKENTNNSKEITEYIDKKNEKINDDMQAINRRLGEISEKLAEIKGQVNKNLEWQDKNAKLIQANADNLVDKEYVDSKIYEQKKCLKKEIEMKLENVDKPQSISELKDKILRLESQMNLSKTARSKDGFKISKVTHDDYDVMDDDEYIDEDIGDVIEKIATGDKLNIFREYLKEAIYSNKPVLVASKNSDSIASVISSIVSGGNYCAVTAGEYCDIDVLIAKINTIKVSGITPVFLIKNVIGVVDSYHSWLTSIRTEEPDCKFIFEIEYENELKFLPEETIDDFIFYSGKMNSSYIEYRYVHPIKERQRINNNEFANNLELLEINIEDKTLANVKFYGLLAYSLIPFKAIHDGISKEDLVNKIIDPKLRSACEVCLDD